MNPYTGQITNDPALIKQWRDAGIPVVDLPDYDASGEVYTTPPVAPHSELLEALGGKIVDLKAQFAEEQRAASDAFCERVRESEARRQNNVRLNQLCGRR